MKELSSVIHLFIHFQPLKVPSQYFPICVPESLTFSSFCIWFHKTLVCLNKIQYHQMLVPLWQLQAMFHVFSCKAVYDSIEILNSRELYYTSRKDVLLVDTVFDVYDALRIWKDFESTFYTVYMCTSCASLLNIGIE